MKILKKKTLKSTNGITLIALVITIIVLIILAGISIGMLAGDNGILQKATLSKEKTERAEIIENAQMDILAKISDKKGENLTQEELEAILTSGDYKTQGTLSNEENILDRILTSKDGKYQIPVSEIYSGNLSQAISPIEYPEGKNATTVEVNDDIKIGSEKFLVIKKTTSLITAIPYYDITLTDAPVQSANAGETSFSQEEYWSYSGEIDMTDSRNNIYKYIQAYQQVLHEMGAKNVTTRVPLRKDTIDLSEFQRNPSKTRGYWEGSIGLNKMVHHISSNRKINASFLFLYRKCHWVWL